MQEHEFTKQTYQHTNILLIIFLLSKMNNHPRRNAHRNVRRNVNYNEDQLANLQAGEVQEAEASDVESEASDEIVPLPRHDPDFVNALDDSSGEEELVPVDPGDDNHGLVVPDGFHHRRAHVRHYGALIPEQICRNPVGGLGPGQVPRIKEIAVTDDSFNQNEVRLSKL